MKRPQPKHEIIIENSFKKETGDNYIKTVTTYSPDAQRWIEQEAPTFGRLQEPIANKMLKALADMTVEMAKKRGEVSDAKYELDTLLKQAPGVTKSELCIEKCYDPDEVVKYLVEGYQQQTKGEQPNGDD